MNESLKQKTISGMIWNAIEKFGSSFFLFISNLILARLLSPNDFGCIGMLMIFISLSNAIIDGGFGNALIQKKEPTQEDYSTIFYWNIFLSITMYGLLYISAPAIAEFYKIPLLSDILRVQGIVLIFNSLTLIQLNILKKKVAFKRITKINLTATVVGTILGITCAYTGLGVWSLVVKTLTTAVIGSLLYWNACYWRATGAFSWKSFSELFKFGGFMFLNTIVVTTSSNLMQLIIGKIFSASVLGYYTQARKMEDLPRGSFSAIVTNVIFPIFSSIQDDLFRVKNAAKKCMKAIAYINFPLMILLIVIARPLFFILFTDKWEQSIPYFQLLCISGIVLTPIEMNCRYIISLGKSSINLRIVSVQCISAIALIFCGMPWQMTGILTGFILSYYITYVISAIYTGRLLNYGLLEQIKDCSPTLLLSLFAGVVSYSLSFLIVNSILLLSCQCLMFAIMYICLSYLFKLDTFLLYSQIIKKIKFTNEKKIRKI
ncbi:lipopolysaccharide biosynthesis protein [uncultured Bacteroides sp.]|uniref:lipopolysaccharide biosynthesis protein n=1 Tax=uncultured Bacteroides sp. TaxID=162156 RepID=UPI002AA6745A|nr:lipopolysaccharide biosynthesis protein [uncultured Bacteroides sp.]